MPLVFNPHDCPVIVTTHSLGPVSGALFDCQSCGSRWRREDEGWHRLSFYDEAGRDPTSVPLPNPKRVS